MGLAFQIIRGERAIPLNLTLLKYVTPRKIIYFDILNDGVATEQYWKKHAT